MDPTSKKFTITDALLSLTPEAEWVLRGIEYSGIEWLSDNITQPSEESVLSEIERLQSEYDSLEYQRLRAAEYPPMEDYLDGIVKNDQDQVDKYLADCQAVKDKYPKPSV